jgi:hypothetical protein
MTEFSDSGRELNPTIIDIKEFVDKTARQFEKSRRGAVRVSAAARLELVASMKPHEDQLLKDLASGSMDTKKLTKILREVFSAAAPPRSLRKYRAVHGRDIRLGGLRRSQINGLGIRRAMKRKCRYLGWC